LPIWLDRSFVGQTNADDGISIQIPPFFGAGANAIHGRADMVQNRWCILFCLLVEEYLQIRCVNVAQSVLSEFGHQMPAKNIPVKVTRGRSIRRENGFLPLSSEVSEGHGRLGSSEPLVDWAQQSVHHLSSVSFSWDRLDRTEDLRTHDTPHSSISLQHVFPPASNPHSPTNSATREQRTPLITTSSHGFLSVDS